MDYIICVQVNRITERQLVAASRDILVMLIGDDICNDLAPVCPNSPIYLEKKKLAPDLIRRIRKFEALSSSFDAYLLYKCCGWARIVPNNVTCIIPSKWNRKVIIGP